MKLNDYMLFSNADHHSWTFAPKAHVLPLSFFATSRWMSSKSLICIACMLFHILTILSECPFLIACINHIHLTLGFGLDRTSSPGIHLPLTLIPWGIFTNFPNIQNTLLHFNFSFNHRPTLQRVRSSSEESSFSPLLTFESPTQNS